MRNSLARKISVNINSTRPLMGLCPPPGSRPSHQQRAEVQIDDRREASECEWVRKER